MSDDPSGTFRSWSSALGIQLAIVVAGFSGGVVSTLFATNLTRKESLGTILASVLTAAYATPAAVAYFNITLPVYQYGTAFLIGLFTMSLVPALKFVGDTYIRGKAQGFIKRGSPPGPGDGKS